MDPDADNPTLLQVLVLERVDRAKNMARFYVLSIEPTLFEDLALVRRWGRIGSVGRERIDLHPSRPVAQIELKKWLDRKRRADTTSGTDSPASGFRRTARPARASLHGVGNSYRRLRWQSEVLRQDPKGLAERPVRYRVLPFPAIARRQNSALSGPRSRLPRSITEMIRSVPRLAAARRVEVWRGDVRLSMSVSAPFVWRCLSGSAVAPFPHPAHRTGRADFPHPALGQDVTRSFACDAIGSF